MLCSGQQFLTAGKTAHQSPSLAGTIKGGNAIFPMLWECIWKQVWMTPVQLFCARSLLSYFFLLLFSVLPAVLFTLLSIPICPLILFLGDAVWCTVANLTSTEKPISPSIHPVPCDFTATSSSLPFYPFFSSFHTFPIWLSCVSCFLLSSHSHLRHPLPCDLTRIFHFLSHFLLSLFPLLFSLLLSVHSSSQLPRLGSIWQPGRVCVCV